MQKLQHLLNEVMKKTEALKTAQALYSRQLAPKFNTFDYINTDELGLSRILAELLNPKGSHGQEEEFLKLFIEHCLPNLNQAANWQPFVEHLEGTTVIVEETTWKSGTSRRMDIYLECKTDGKRYGICIENKPYASDQFEQLKDYAIELGNRKLDHWYIIYLNEYSDTPSEHSINPDKLDQLIKANRFSVLRFSGLIDWLQACKVDCQNHSVTEFLEQLVKFIQKQFMGIKDMSETNAVLEIMQQNDENIEASIQIANNVDEMKKQLIQKLVQDVKSEFAQEYMNKPYELDVSYIGEGARYERIKLIIPDYEKAYICFEFDNAGFNSPCLGIKFISVEAAEAYPYTDKVKNLLEGRFSEERIWSSSLWPAGYYFQPKDWRNSSEAWQMIRDGKMASKIMEEMDAMFKILNDNSCSND